MCKTFYKNGQWSVVFNSKTIHVGTLAECLSVSEVLKLINL